jgi:hypothetical protein
MRSTNRQMRITHLMLAIVVSALAMTAVLWWFDIGNQQVVTRSARITILRQSPATPHLRVGRPPRDLLAADEQFRAAQLRLVKSRHVLSDVVRDPDVSSTGLQPVWLERNLQARVEGDSILISLRGRNRRAIEAALNATCRSYLKIASRESACWQDLPINYKYKWFERPFISVTRKAGAGPPPRPRSGTPGRGRASLQQ